LESNKNKTLYMRTYIHLWSHLYKGDDSVLC